jgi:hypothetical protein
MSSHTPDAIPGLLNEIVVTHILREDSLLTHADLARLRAVSQSMRNAVGETGRFAPFYRPAVQAAQEHEGKPHDWPSVNIGSLCVDLRTDPASALVSVCPPKVNGEPSPRTRTRRAITSEELRAPLVDRYNGHLPTPLRRRTLTFGVVVEVFKPGDSLGSFEMYKDITANGGRVRLQKAFDVDSRRRRRDHAASIPKEAPHAGPVLGPRRTLGNMGGLRKRRGDAPGSDATHRVLPDDRAR